MHPRPRALGTAALALAALGLPACESYQKAPLDLPAHREAWARRALDAEPPAAFAQRLRQAGQPAPDRFDLADGLTPAEGEVLALLYNPTLRVARLQAGVARAQADHAGRWQDPEFGFDAAEILSPAGVFQYGARLSLTLPVSGRLAAERDRAGAEHEAALRRVVDQEWALRAEVRRAWGAWLTARRAVHLHREALQRVSTLDEIAGRLVEAGEVTRIEGRMFHVEHSGRRVELARAVLHERNTRRKVLGLMGLPPDAAVELVGSSPELGGALPELPEDVLISRNTALAVHRAEYHAAEQALRVEVREQYPDITIGGGYGSEDRDDRLLLGFSLPVPILNANRGGIAAARAQREVARAAAEGAFEALAHELAWALAELESAAAVREAYEREVVPLLGEQRDEIDRLSGLGALDTLIVLEAVSREVEAKQRLLELFQSEVEARVRVIELLGPETEPSPAPVVGPAEQGESR